MEKIRVAAVVGPTAVGKSRLAVEIALRFGGEIVSADSMQIYQGLEIGTAQPTEAEKRGVSHHLIGFLDPMESFSVANYVGLASKCILEIHKRKSLPIVAGGTGLYVRSLLTNLRFSPRARDEKLHAELLRRAREQGTGSLVEELRSFDPQSAERIHPNDAGRLVRAIELYRVTGMTMTEQIARSQNTPPPYDVRAVGLTYRDREKLYAAIDRRVDQMMEAGLPREAEKVYTLPGSATATQAIGYKEFFPYFRGECSLTEAEEAVKRESRRYAKRQLTWFRRDACIQWIFLDDLPAYESVCQRAVEILREGGWQP